MDRLKQVRLLTIGIGVLCLALVGCAERPVGSKQRPFTMYFVPFQDADSITLVADRMVDLVSQRVSQVLYGKDTGFYIKSSVPTSYVAVVEAFGTKKADFAALTTFSYILCRDIKKYDIEALISLVRGHGEKTYRGQIIARADSGIRSIEDLAGKKFAYTDPASTSGYILPSSLFRKKGIELGESVFAQKHDNVVTMVYQGQVDAGATFHSTPEVHKKDGKEVKVYRDARIRVVKQFPDVIDKVKIIGFTDSVPNEPWVIRKQLYADSKKNELVKRTIRDALIEFGQTEQGKKDLKQLYTVTGLAPATDSMFDGIRKIILSSELDLESLVGRKKPKPKKKG